MSEKPTSAGDVEALAELERAGWDNAELVWEQIQEAAAECAAAGDAQQAAELWSGALEVAEEWFRADDPRLATSLVNKAATLVGSAREYERTAMLERALQIWDGAAAWVAGLRPEHSARSSTFHLRLLAKHRGGYDRHARDRHAALARLGRGALIAHLGGTPEHMPDGLTQWRREKTSRLTDARKLLAAVYLMTRAKPDARS